MGTGKERFRELLELMPEGWEAKARELGALRRAREVKTAEDLLRVIFLYLTAGKSFAGTSAIVRLGGEIHLNKIAAYKRIRNSAEWLQWLCENIYRHSGMLVKKPGWLAGKNVCLVDGSEDVTCGKEKAYYRLHYCVDLFSLGIRELRVTDIRTGEQLANFASLGKEDIVIADRIYGTIPGMEYAAGNGSGYVVRLRARAFNLYDGKRRKIDLLSRLEGLNEGKVREIRANYINGKGELVPVRVCAIRKDRDSERAGQRRLTKTSQRKNGGKPVSRLQKEFNQYIIVATSLGTEVRAGQVLELYRMRWQIELAFKRLKTLFEYNEIPVKLDMSAHAWFYGKLLLAALCETVVNKGRFSPSGKQKKTIRSTWNA